MTLKVKRPGQRQEAFRDLARIINQQSVRENESQFASNLRAFAKKNGIPSRNIFRFNKRMLAPFFVKKGRIKRFRRE